MIVAAIVGGFYGMRFARRLKPDALRAVVLVVGAGLTTWYFYKAYGTR
jgi:uncharacterized membrane protein YfcA